MYELISKGLTLNTEFIKFILGLVSKNPSISDYIVYTLVYFAPTILSLFRSECNRLKIFICNLIFGFTGVGWLVVFVWAWVEKPAKRMGKLCPHCNAFLEFKATACHHCCKPLADDEENEKNSVSK